VKAFFIPMEQLELKYGNRFYFIASNTSPDPSICLDSSIPHFLRVCNVPSYTALNNGWRQSSMGESACLYMRVFSHLFFFFTLHQFFFSLVLCEHLWTQHLMVPTVPPCLSGSSLRGHPVIWMRLFHVVAQLPNGTRIRPRRLIEARASVCL